MTQGSLFADTDLPSPITEFVVQITSNLEGQDHYASGTGVIVAPFLAFAARHVLEEHWHRHHNEPMRLAGEQVGRFSFVLAQLVADGLNLWTVTRLWASGDTDIVILRLTPYSEGARHYQFRHMTLDVMAPRIGEHVHGFGYADSAITVAGAKQLSVRQSAKTTHGDVVEVFYDRRDPIRLPFPCFRTNARFDGGMSGGPIFNDAGHLCGLICSTYPPFTPDEDHASYAVLLWPIMGMPIDMNRVGRPPGERIRVFDLVGENILMTVNADKLTVGNLPEDGGGASVQLFVP